MFSYIKVIVTGTVTVDGVSLGSLLMRRNVVIVGNGTTATITCSGNQINRAIQVSNKVELADTSGMCARGVSICGVCGVVSNCRCVAARRWYFRT